MRHGIAIVALLTCARVLGLAQSEHPQNIAWLTGRALDRALMAEAGVGWREVPLREALRDLGQAQRVAILLDRRIDPSRPLDISSHEPLRKILDRVAESRGARVAVARGVVYLGPAPAAAALPSAMKTLRSSVDRLPRAAQRPLLRMREFRWEELTTPRELLDRLAVESGSTIEGVQEIPHDLWGAADFPPLTWIDRAQLVLVQFDRTLEIDARGRGLTLVPLPAVDDAVVESGVPAPKPVRNRAARRTARLEVRETPLREVLEAVAGQFDRELRIDEGAEAAQLDQRVTLSLHDLELEALLERLLAARGLHYRLAEGRIEITPQATD